MAERRPLVIVGDEVAELPLGDTLPVGGGVVWQVVSTATTMAAGTAYIVTAAVNMTLPAVAAGDEFIVHAKVNGVRVVSNGNVITGVGSGNDLAIGAGETAHLVASASGTVEIV